MGPKSGRDSAQASKPRPLPANADYSDEVTDVHLERIKDLVKKEEFEDAEELSGPAW